MVPLTRRDLLSIQLKLIFIIRYRERTEIGVIRGQKQSVILGMLWLICHNPEINQRTRELKMMRCLEEYGKQWRPKQGKSEQQNQRKKKKKKQKERNKKKKKKKKTKKEKNNGSEEDSRGVGDLE